MHLMDEGKFDTNPYVLTGELMFRKDSLSKICCWLMPKAGFGKGVVHRSCLPAGRACEHDDASNCDLHQPAKQGKPLCDNAPSLSGWLQVLFLLLSRACVVSLNFEGERMFVGRHKRKKQ